MQAVIYIFKRIKITCTCNSRLFPIFQTFKMSDEIAQFISTQFIKDGDFQQMHVQKKTYFMMLKLAKSCEDLNLQQYVKKALYYSYSDDITFMLRYLELLSSDKTIKIWHFILLNFKKQQVGAILRFMIKFPIHTFHAFHELNEPYLSLYTVLLVLACRNAAFKSIAISFAIKSLDVRYLRLLISLKYNAAIPNNILSKSLQGIFYTRQIHMEHDFIAGNEKYKIKKLPLKYFSGVFNEHVIQCINNIPTTILEESVYSCNILYYLKNASKENSSKCTAAMAPEIKKKISKLYKYVTISILPEQGPTSILPTGFKIYQDQPTIGVMRKIKKFASELQACVLNNEEKHALTNILNKFI